jgi:hypothetical protein
MSLLSYCSLTTRSDICGHSGNLIVTIEVWYLQLQLCLVPF